MPKKDKFNISEPVKCANGFVAYKGGSNDYPSDIKKALGELEEKMFGIYRPLVQEQRLSDSDWIPIKTGTGFKLLKEGPKHILDAEDPEPLYTP